MITALTASIKQGLYLGRDTLQAMNRNIQRAGWELAVRESRSYVLTGFVNLTNAFHFWHRSHHAKTSTIFACKQTNQNFKDFGLSTLLRFLMLPVRLEKAEVIFIRNTSTTGNLQYYMRPSPYRPILFCLNTKQRNNEQLWINYRFF